MPPTFAHKLALIAIASCWLSVAYSLAYAEDADWPVYLGGKERNLYSPLNQIGVNVGTLLFSGDFLSPQTVEANRFGWKCSRLESLGTLAQVREDKN